MSYSLNDFYRESDKQLNYFDQQISEYASIIKENDKNMGNLNAQKSDVLLQMARLIAPNFSEEELEKISKLLHKTSLATLDNEMRDEEAALRKRLAEIEADPEFIKKDHLTAPRTGEYTRELDQIRPVFEKVNQEFAPFEAQKALFEDLINDKYGTPEYEHTGILRFFNSEHLDNWRIGDLLCEKFGYDSFPELREVYLDTQKRFLELLDAVQYYTKKIDNIYNMDSEQREITKTLPNLRSKYEQKLAQEIEQFLSSTSAESKQAFFKAYKKLEDVAKVQQGLTFQAQYLKDLRIKLDSEKHVLMEKRNKLSQERYRYQSNGYKYANKTFDRDKFTKRFNRNPSYTKQRFEKYRKTSSTIYNFNNYNSAPNASDIFWWGLITNNRVDGSFSPSVNEYYSTHTHSDFLDMMRTTQDEKYRESEDETFDHSSRSTDQS